MSSFKFQQNRTISEEFYFLRGKGGGEKGHHLLILFSIIIGKHVKIFRFKFQQNRTINEEFNSFEGGRGRSGPRRVRGLLIINLYRNYYW